MATFSHYKNTTLAWFFPVGVLCVIVVFLSYALVAGKESDYVLSPVKSIVLTSSGFLPAQLVINQGDTVVFSAEVDREFWPASDSHPTHNIYPEFDPKRPLSPGESWSTTFTRPGKWKFHDHLRSNDEGEIIVLGSEPLQEDPCVEGGSKEACFAHTITLTLKGKGLDPALDTLAFLYDTEPDFRASCHSVTHTLGKAAYALFKEGKEISLSQKTSYCSFGFYHGFVEEMLQTSGDVNEVKRFCAKTSESLSAESANVEGACYHGIGHGTMDGSDPRSWGDIKAMVDPSLRICEAVDPSEPNFFRCASGAFNSLAIMLRGEQYNLKPADHDPYSACLLWSDPRILKACYYEMNTLAIHMAGGDFLQAIRVIASIKDDDSAYIAMQGLAGTVPSSFKDFSKAEYEEAAEACHTAQLRTRTACIRGIPGGLMEISTPGEEYVTAIDFCMTPSLAGAERLECMKTVFSGIRMYYPLDKRNEICSQIEERYRPYCYNPAVTPGAIPI